MDGRRSVVFLGVMSLMGCASNIAHIQESSEAVPKARAFDGTIDRVWGAAQKALAEDETFKVLDKSSRLMVTEWRTIDAKELSLAQTYFLGKTYKNNYTVSFEPVGTKVEVRVSVKLQAVQVVFLAREESNEAVESHLRKRLFERIAANLRT